MEAVSRKDKRRLSGKTSSLLSDLEDDFSYVESNIRTSFEKDKNEAVTKEVTNREQTSNKPVTKEVTNREQTSNKVITNSETKEKPKAETGNKVVSKPVTVQVTNRQQTSNKVVTSVSFSMLVGLQRDLAIFFYESCKRNRSKITESISLEHITLTFNITTGVAKTTIRRLEHKNCIARVEFKNGRGGWSKYELTDSLYGEMLQIESGNKLITNREQTSSKVVSKPVTEPVTSTPSSSSYINNTTTNYKADALAQIELNEALIQFGFNQGHVEQLLRDSSLSSELIQNSLDAFAFDLGFEDVKKKVRSPIGLIMKLLKNGQTYISEKGYESEEDRLYRELIERAEKKKEEKLKLESRMAEIKFEEWLENISDEEKRNLVAPIGEFMGLLHRQELKEYFKREVYE